MATNVTDKEKKAIILWRKMGYSVLDIAVYSRRSESTIRRIFRECKKNGS